MTVLCPCIYPDVDPDEPEVCACGHAPDEHDDTGQCQVPDQATVDTRPSAAPDLPPHPFEPGGPGGTCNHAFDREFKHYCGLAADHSAHTATAPYAGGEGRE